MTPPYGDETSVHDPETIRRAVSRGHANALRLALFQATGDPTLIQMTLTEQPVYGGAFAQLVLSESDAAIVRERALDFLLSGRLTANDAPDDDALRRMMEIFIGGPVGDPLFRMGKEELKFDEFPRGVDWEREPSPDVKQAFPVVIIGAGGGGLTAAVQLGRLGIPYTILERNAGVGGTWWVNDYPDCRVDIVSHNYQLSYMKKYPWKHFYATQEELRAYFEEITERYDIRKNIRFSAELIEARWDEATASWRLTFRNAEGANETISARAVISAAGLFNQPNRPDIPGIDDFAGRLLHPTEWDPHYDWAGKRVAVIGNGSTGAQLMPRLARDAAQVTVFQRTPQWIGHREGYREPIGDDLQWLFDNMPHYWNWYCFAIFQMMYDVEGLQNFDREWQRNGGRVSKKNDALHAHLVNYIQSKVGHDPELVRKLTPNYPPFARRLVADNGWYDALLRPNVELVTEGIERITETGILAKDGVSRPFDLIVLAAGFKTERYLWPVRYEGRRGMTLETLWEKDGARAYLGMMAPGFPNFFMLYGPNAQARTSGLLPWLEIWARYAVKSITHLIEEGSRSMDVRQELYDDYNARMDEALKHCTWGAEGGLSYYINEHGRQGTNMPWLPADYFEWVRTPNLADFVIR